MINASFLFSLNPCVKYIEVQKQGPNKYLFHYATKATLQRGPRTDTSIMYHAKYSGVDRKFVRWSKGETFPTEIFPLDLWWTDLWNRGADSKINLIVRHVMCKAVNFKSMWATLTICVWIELYVNFERKIWNIIIITPILLVWILLYFSDKIRNFLTNWLFGSTGGIPPLLSPLYLHHWLNTAPCIMRHVFFQ